MLITRVPNAVLGYIRAPLNCAKIPGYALPERGLIIIRAHEFLNEFISR